MDWTLDWSKRRHRVACIMLDWRLTEANGSDRVTPIRPMATVLVKGRWGRIPSEADMQLGAPCVGIHPCSECVLGEGEGGGASMVLCANYVLISVYASHLRVTRANSEAPTPTECSCH